MGLKMKADFGRNVIQLSNPTNARQTRKPRGASPCGTECSIRAKGAVRAKYAVRSEHATGPEGTVGSELWKQNHQP